LEAITQDFQQFEFIPAKFFMWSPHDNAIFYDQRRVKANDGLMALLHEIGHASLGHRIYKFDMELIQMELDAWDVARVLAPKYGVSIDEEHVTMVVGTYDEWLTKRATCPDCQNFSLQRGRDEYGCFDCGAIWQVNWRKDRRVTRYIIERYQHPVLVTQFNEKRA
jgi:hypothetical protein